MASPQHVFRRGHIFWWRRVHLLVPKRRIDVRLSLGTTKRFEASNLGATLSAAMPKVKAVLKENIEAHSDITDSELRDIAAAM